MSKLSNYIPALRFGKANAAKFTNATGSSNAATSNGVAGEVTTESLSTSAAAEETYTITNSKVKAGDIVLVNVRNGTNTSHGAIGQVRTIFNGSFVVVITNTNASALNGTLVIQYVVIKPV